jgi:hypothetical protein
MLSRSRTSAGNRRIGLRNTLHPGLLPALGALLLFAGSAGASCFTEQPQFGSRPTITLAWNDADGDGDLDLAVGNYQQPNQLFVNNGDGTFTEQAQFGTGATFALAWADFDNDGDPDMAVGRGNGQQNYLFRNNGDGTFTQLDRFGLHRTTSVAWGDADNDGDLDLAVGTGILGVAEQNYLYVNAGGGNFTQVPQFGTGQTDAVAWGDFDRDGDLDLAVGNGGFGFIGQNFLYVNNGNGTFTERPEFGTGDTASLDWGDFDNDGDLDLAVGNWNATQCYLFVNNGNGTFTGHPEFGARDTNTVGWGDYDNDGDLDLAVGNGDFQSGDQAFLYVNNGNGTFTEEPQFGTGSTDAVVWGDYDRDGDLDLATGNEHHPTQNFLYVNCLGPGTFLDVHLVGHFHDRGIPYSNRDGVGARVSVYDAGFAGDPAHLRGFREVSAHGGFAAQSTRDPHFGLPGASSVDLQITWPGSGAHHIVQSVLGVAVGQRLAVDEEAPPAAVTGRGRPAAGIRIVPNPMRDRASIELLFPSTGAQRIAIVNVQGRRIRLLSPLEAGSVRRLEWDGMTDEGRPAPAGLYIVTREGAGGGRAGLLLVR